MKETIYKGISIRISEEVNQRLIDHLDYKVVKSKWIDEAILEKIAREKESNTNLLG